MKPLEDFCASFLTWDCFETFPWTETKISEKVWSTDQWNPSKTFAPPFWHDWKGSYSDRSERNGTFHVVLVSRITFKVFMILNPLLQKQNLNNQNYVLLTWADEIFLYKLLFKKNFKKKVKFIQVFIILNHLLQKQNSEQCTTY